jgi:hypothetical protein
VLVRRLQQVRDVRKSRARGSLGHTCHAGRS